MWDPISKMARTPSLFCYVSVILLLASPVPIARAQQDTEPSLLSLAPPSLGPESPAPAGGSVAASKSSSGGMPFSWTLPPFAPVSPRVPSERCRADSELYLKELESLTLWAAEMFDASAKFPTGLLHGSTLEAGNFDECLAIETTSGTHPMSAKYCLSSVRLRLPASLELENHKHQLIWHKIKNSTLIPYHKRRDLLYWGLCIPSSCSALDLQIHLQHSLEPFAAALGGEAVVGSDIDELDGPTISVTVEESHCQRGDTDGPQSRSKPLTTGEIIVGCWFALALLLVIGGTGYDVYQRTFGTKEDQFKNKGAMEKYLLCFSAYANGLKLFEDEVSDNPLQFLNGAKFYSICLIIMGHRIFFSLGGPIMNSQYVEQFYNSFEVVILLGGTIVVDTFFTISGCLLSFIILTEYKKYKSQLSIPILYINRFIRLTPLYMAVVGLYATLLPRISSGPMWPQRIKVESDRCSNNWWTNLLYINSFVKPEDMCMLQSWYLSSDMQLFVLGAPLALLLAKRPNLGKIVLAAFLIISSIIPFVLTYVLSLEPIFPVYMETVKDLLANEAYLTTYVPTYMRGSPYFIGMLMGYLIYDHRQRKVTISPVTAVIGYVLCTSAMMAPILISWLFYTPLWTYNPLWAAFYASLHRISWSGGIGWGIYALTTEYGWLFGRFFGWKRIFPLGRLTYSAFLVHCGLQLIDVASLRAPLYLSIYNMTLSVMADTILSFLLGFFMSILFEAPVLSLQRVLLQSTKIKKDTDEGMVSVVEEPAKTVGDPLAFPTHPYTFHQQDNSAYIHDENQDVHL
ncbi:nose resistant to fluoxetine protein 6-like [Ischnura elegans]|uniref:nose resistant to fluoxetine protein 6-like n=1 Tax=Ischnura elegans TaxID=197161 RepID=UPI001ED8AC52|nr:nose resistant to fluoxetine protein 6-like [Ischnura elegans]